MQKKPNKQKNPLFRIYSDGQMALPDLQLTEVFSRTFLLSLRGTHVLHSGTLALPD